MTYTEDCLKKISEFSETFERCYATLLKPVIVQQEESFKQLNIRKQGETEEAHKARVRRFMEVIQPAGMAAKNLSELYIALHDIYLAQCEQLSKIK